MTDLLNRAAVTGARGGAARPLPQPPGRLRARAWAALCAALLALSLTPVTPSAAAAECNGDECEAPPPAPEDPTPGTAIVEAPGNPPVHYPKVRCPAGKRRVVSHGASHCVRVKPRHHRHRHRGGRP